LVSWSSGEWRPRWLSVQTFGCGFFRFFQDNVAKADHFQIRAGFDEFGMGSGDAAGADDGDF
jgi:hypothetical protein